MPCVSGNGPVHAHSRSRRWTAQISSSRQNLFRRIDRQDPAQKLYQNRSGQLLGLTHMRDLFRRVMNVVPAAKAQPKEPRHRYVASPICVIFSGGPEGGAGTPCAMGNHGVAASIHGKSIM